MARLRQSAHALVGLQALSMGVSECLGQLERAQGARRKAAVRELAIGTQNEPKMFIRSAQQQAAAGNNRHQQAAAGKQQATG